MFEETVKKGTCLTVTPAFQNMPKSGLKITSPRYLLPKDLAEAAELSVSTITEPIKRIIEIFGTVYLRTVSVTNTVQKIHIAVVAALAYLFTAMPGFQISCIFITHYIIAIFDIIVRCAGSKSMICVSARTLK